MATSSTKAAELLRDLVNKSTLNVITLKWPAFYDVIERERLSDAFIAEVVKKAKDASLHVSFGNATVLVAKDYDFAPK